MNTADTWLSSADLTWNSRLADYKSVVFRQSQTVKCFLIYLFIQGMCPILSTLHERRSRSQASSKAFIHLDQSLSKPKESR